MVIRDVSGSHMYNNGNKRAALAIAELLMARNGVASGPTLADLSIEDIAAALRGY